MSWIVKFLLRIVNLKSKQELVTHPRLTLAIFTADVFHTIAKASSVFF